MRDPRTPLLAFAATLAVLVVLLLALLAAGVWWGGHPEDLPGFLQRVFVANRNTRVVDEALARIHHDYYRPVGEGSSPMPRSRAPSRAWATASPTTSPRAN